MDELERLWQEVELLKQRMKYLEDTFATLADMNKSSEMGQYIAQRQRTLAASKLVNAAAGSQKLNADAQQQVIDQLAAEKAAMDARIEEAIRAAEQNAPAEDDLAEQFTYKNITGGVQIQGFNGFETKDEFVIPSKIGGKFVVRIGENAFTNMKFKKVVLPKYVESIGGRAFYGCCDLEEVIFPASVTSIGQLAFRNCEKLARVTLPPNLKLLCDFSFAGTAIEYIEIPEKVKILTLGCFSDCEKLKKVLLNEGLERIERLSFSDTGVTNIVVPKSVQTVQDESFIRYGKRMVDVAILGKETVVEEKAPCITFYCLPGSTVQRSGRLNGLNIKPLSEFKRV